MPDLNFESRNFEMAKSVIRRLLLRGLFRNEVDARSKITDPTWLAEQGYRSVAKALSGDLGQQACRAVFEEIEAESGSLFKE